MTVVNSDVVAQETLAAYDAIKALIYRTPLQRARWLESEGSDSSTKGENGINVFVKLESEQITGSFKARGAMHKVLSLSKEERSKGIITASTGNHALAVVHASNAVGGSNLSYEVVLPKSASTAKVEALQSLGAPLRFHGKDCAVAEEYARCDANENEKSYISPYNDLKVVAGQGTIGVEILEQLQEQNYTAPLDAIFVPVGGGGLIAGIGAYLKFTSPKTKIYGCIPKNDAHMARSVAAGNLVAVGSYEENDGITISEGTAGAVEQGSVTFPLCMNVVDEWLEITEEEIGIAVVDMLRFHHKAVEGAAGLGIAGFRKRRANFTKNECVAVVICGGNVKAEMMRDLLNAYMPNP